jgi:lipopolysaccharide export system permease protein
VKTIEKYVFGSFLSSFTLAFLVLSFVLTIGLLVQIVELIIDGVEMSLVGEFCLVSLPETLQWSMPLALLVSSILVFSRMSADSEIAAMRACGINLFTVMRWPVLFGILCTVIGVIVNNEIVPRGHEIRRTLKTKVSVGAGLNVLEPGRIIDDFPNVKLYFGSKEGNWLHDLVVLDYSNPKFDRLITAEKALVTQEGKDVHLDLYQMTVDPFDEKNQSMARANRFRYTMEDAIRKSQYNRKIKDFRMLEMFGHISKLDDKIKEVRIEGDKDRKESAKARLKFLKRDRSAAKVELNKRFVFAAASFCFVLVGIPLGIRSHRKESSIGMALALAVSLGFYLVVIISDSCKKNFSMHPEFIIWLSVVLSLVFSVKLIRRNL